MFILAVDPDPSDLEQLVRCLEQAYPYDSILSFADPLLAYQYGFSHPVDAVYTVEQMKRLDGFLLSKMLKKDNPKLLIYLIRTSYSTVERHASLPVNGYLNKPVTAQAILGLNA